MTSPALDTTGMADARRLDVSDPATFDLWCAQPAYDQRTLEEFAEDGGPLWIEGPPNRPPSTLVFLHGGLPCIRSGCLKHAEIGAYCKKHLPTRNTGTR